MSDDTTVKQYPYSLKGEQTQSGLWKLTVHVYGDSADQVVTDTVRLLSMGITEYERKGWPLLVNSGKEIVEKVKKK